LNKGSLRHHNPSSDSVCCLLPSNDPSPSSFRPNDGLAAVARHSAHRVIYRPTRNSYKNTFTK